MRRSVILGTGSYLPQRRMSNHELAQKIDTSDEWITQRTGIRYRHIADVGESTSTMALAAAKQAIGMAALDSGVDAFVLTREIDLIIVATATPDKTFPAVATQVQAALALSGQPAFDVQAVCSGFIYALTLADSLIQLGRAQKALVIGAETFSRILDWQDRTTCVLFGDGAGAVLLGAEMQPGAKTDRGLLASALHADGHHHDFLYTSGGVATNQIAGFIKMQGKEVFRHAVEKMSDVLSEVIAQSGIDAAAIDWLVPHQANKRIIEATAEKMQMSLDKVIITVDQHGNTSAASIPLALDTAVRDGRIQRGHLLAFESMGAGFTWAAALLRY